ncbi:hypothetical protein D1007_58349 [Hordeum vulgare]|nr:hypothetical protein D1007_58349 [Hordeum vulgare]
MANQKWQQVVAGLKAEKKRNDGSRSHKSIGLGDDDDDVVVNNGKATMRKDNRLLMGTKWEKARISRDARKMSSTWTNIFPEWESKKEERYKLMVDAQREGRDWTRAERGLEIEREKIELEKQEAGIKWELEKAKTFGEIELENERKKEINDLRALEAAWATTAAAVEEVARMQAMEAAWM